MRNFSVIFVLLMAASAWAQLAGSKSKPYIKADETKDKFGAELTLKEKPISVDEVIERFKASKDTSPVVLNAKIEKVCKKKGCWMTVKGKTSEVRVIFKDYGFFVPMSLVGKEVLVEGSMKEEKLTLAETRHFVQDEGGDPSKVTEARTDYQFVATGVAVKK